MCFVLVRPRVRPYHGVGKSERARASDHVQARSSRQLVDKKFNHMNTLDKLIAQFALLALGIVAVVLGQKLEQAKQVEPEVSASREPLSFWAERLGFILIGGVLFRVSATAYDWHLERKRKTQVDAVLSSQVRQEKRHKDLRLPTLIAADIEGCITPAYRGSLDLVRLQRVEAYCRFRLRNPQYPPLVFFSGRSQGYVELLSQALGLVDQVPEVPSVIENGSALYYPRSKTSKRLITNDELSQVKRAEAILRANLPSNEFEPKAFTITINPTQAENIEHLRDKIIKLLDVAGLRAQLSITSSASAVDIAATSATKLSGVTSVVELLPDSSRSRGLAGVAAIGDHQSDLEVLENVGMPYCPAGEVNDQVLRMVKGKAPDNVISQIPPDTLLKMIESSCKLTII